MDNAKTDYLKDGLTDALTGVGSRDALDMYLTTELHRLARLDRRYNERFLCCDIDNFGHHTESLGFHGSDVTLVDLAASMSIGLAATNLSYGVRTLP